MINISLKKNWSEILTIIFIPTLIYIATSYINVQSEMKILKSQVGALQSDREVMKKFLRITMEKTQINDTEIKNFLSALCRSIINGKEKKSYEAKNNQNGKENPLKL